MVTIAQAMLIQPEATLHGPLSLHLEDIVVGCPPPLGAEGRAVLDLLYKYNHVFPAPGDLVTGRIQAVWQEIETNGARPVQCGPRRFAPAGLRTEQVCVRDICWKGDKLNQVTVLGVTRCVGN